MINRIMTQESTQKGRFRCVLGKVLYLQNEF